MLVKHNKKRIYRKSGQVVKIELGQGFCSYARVLNEPILGFYDFLFEKDALISLKDIIRLPIAFKLMVMNYAITNGRWMIIGHEILCQDLQNPPAFYKFDMETGKFFIYQELSELSPHYERPARAEECLGLEVAAVWEPEHVEDRLRDHFAGQPNKWVEQLKPVR